MRRADPSRLRISTAPSAAAAGLQRERGHRRPARLASAGRFDIASGETRVLADIEGPGAIQQIWATVRGARWRFLILRIYWDDQRHPSVECPIGDFFANGWERYAHVNSLAVCV